MPLALGRDRARFLAVKDGLRIAPWADALYACDHHWWMAHRGMLRFGGARICWDERTMTEWRGVKFLRVKMSPSHQDMLFGETGTIGWGGNSGYHAVNLAAQFGARRIILVGFDMRIDQGRHFFGNHLYTNQRPSQANVDRWRPIMDRQATGLRERGIEVVNCSPVSALTAYPKMSFEDALNDAFHLDRL